MKRSLRTPWALAVVFLFAIIAPARTHAADAAAMMAQLDAAASGVMGLQLSGSAEVWKGGHKEKTLQFDMRIKDVGTQSITFTAPGDVAGMRVLMKESVVYVYTPEFKKVRTIAAHAQNQGFLGSELTPEDMVQTNLSAKFTARTRREGSSETILDLTPRADRTSSWSKLELTIDKTRGGVTKLRYFDGAGRAVREQTRERWQRFGGQQLPTRIRFKNLLTGAMTVVQLSTIKVKQRFADSLFSKRSLLP